MFNKVDKTVKILYNTLNSIQGGDKMLLKDLIAEYVANNSISYRAFAKQTGVSSAYLSMINAGVNPSTGRPPVVSFQKLSKIAEGMGMSVHQLIQLVDDMEVDIGPESSLNSSFDQLSPAALAVARAYDQMSGYGKSMIDKIVENEKAYKVVKAVPLMEMGDDSKLMVEYLHGKRQKEMDQVSQDYENQLNAAFDANNNDE